MNRTTTFAAALIALTGVLGVNAPVSAQHLVVLDAPCNFVDAAASLGFVDVEKLQLEAVTAKSFRVPVPHDGNADSMIQVLKARFPAATIDTEAADDFQITH